MSADLKADARLTVTDAGALLVEMSRPTFAALIAVARANGPGICEVALDYADGPLHRVQYVLRVDEAGFAIERTSYISSRDQDFQTCLTELPHRTWDKWRWSEEQPGDFVNVGDTFQGVLS